MAQKINIGNQSNDGTGDSIRDAFNKVNNNFDELYAINNLGGGLFFTKLKDTPSELLASTATSPAVVVSNNFGSALLQKRIVAGQGIRIDNTRTDTIVIENPNSTLSSDAFPELGGNLNGNIYRAVNFSNPQDPQDLVTLDYFEKNSIYSRTNLYVSLNGTDDGQTNFPPEKRGRALAYAYRSVLAACQAAEEIINNSPVEVGVYGQYITIDNGTTATVYATTASVGIIGDTRLFIDVTSYEGTDPFITENIRPGQYIFGMYTKTVAFINDLGQTSDGGVDLEFYDVRYEQDPTGNGFSIGEPMQYGTQAVSTQITISIESGIYEEHLPIRIPVGVSLRGDEFRRSIIKPAPFISESPYAKLYFRRDDNFDGLTRSSNNGTTGLAAPGQQFGYHYLSDPTDPDSTPLPNDQMDVFLMNDTTIIRGISCQGHGGFMCVLDPEGQILTKSPYVQQCSSFSRSLNKQMFAGGVYLDGFAGNLNALPDDGATYFLGTTTFAVSSLQRNLQTPCTFYYLGNRYEINYVTDWNPTTNTAVLHLNPRNAGGIAYANGTVPVNSGAGYSPSIPPFVVFSQPSTAGGFPTQGIANINAGQIVSVTITNPGSGYKDTDVVTIEFQGGEPITTATTITVPSGNIKKGFIGILPSPIEIGTAGNKSLCAADFTQLNDLGYGIVMTNNARIELVSVFSYYSHVSYYAANGAEGRSLNGSTVYGDFGIKAEGSDPNEVPIPIRLSTDMIQTATVVSGVVGGINAVNTGGSTSIYVKNYTYIPYSFSEFEIDHGTALDNNGNFLGVTRYEIVSASSATNTVIPDLLKIDIAGGGGVGFGSGVGLRAPISTGTSIVLRSKKIHRITGINPLTIVRPSTALQFLESTSTTYDVLSYDTTSDSKLGDARAYSRDAYNYVSLQVPLGVGIAPISGSSSLTIYQVSADDRNRLQYDIANPDKQMIFGWKDRIYKVTGYTTSTNNTATITISPALISTVTTVAATGTVVLLAGLQKNMLGEVTTRVSNLRVSNHDMAFVGSGSWEESNVPNDILGPSRNIPNPVNERVKVGKGRVYAVTTDQDGNFKVGDFFQVNQGTGDITISANLNLTQVDGLGFRRGVVVKEFSAAGDMGQERLDAVPTERAVVEYLNKRLGVNVNGIEQTGKFGPAFLDLAGVQKMTGVLKTNSNNIDVQGGFVVNVTTATTSTFSLYAANKGYVDSYTHIKLDLAGTNAVDPISGAGTPSKGVMTGPLMLSGDPTTSTSLVQAVTRRYVDQIRQLNTLSDVTYTADQDGHFLMLADAMPASTATSKPLWSSSRRVINVANSNTSNVIITKTSGNTVASWISLTIQTNTITNAMINSNAAIVQSKLSMSAAGVGSTSSGVVQANLGLAQFDQTYFAAPDATGWITLKSPSLFDINAKTAAKVENALTKGDYLTYSAGTTYDGSAAVTVAVDATDANTASKIVARDSSGNFSAGTMTGDLKGDVYDSGGNKVIEAGSNTTDGWFSGSYVKVGTVCKQGTNGSGNIGQDGNRFGTAYINTMCGTSTSANYADLAENYLADRPYVPCTVLEFGGTCEVTSAEDGTRRVAGVVSTNPAHLMNSALTGDNVVALALQGRVPCKVRGKVRKGDMMVSAGGGYARSEFNPVLGSIIGKALEDFDGQEGIIEIVVGRL
jgi:hypothetical protein